MHLKLAKRDALWVVPKMWIDCAKGYGFWGLRRPTVVWYGARG